MCSSYSGPSGTGIQAYLRDKTGNTKLPGGGGGTSTGGFSGPSAAGAMATQYMRQKATAPALDAKLGVGNNG